MIVATSIIELYRDTRGMTHNIAHICYPTHDMAKSILHTIVPWQNIILSYVSLDCVNSCNIIFSILVPVCAVHATKSIRNGKSMVLDAGIMAMAISVLNYWYVSSLYTLAM